MKNYIILFILFTLSWSGLLAMETISVTGKHFINSKGEPVIFHGVSTSDPAKLVKDNHWNEDYFREITDWGFNIVRFPVHPSAWRELGKKDYLKLLDQGVSWAEKFNMHVIIDWHIIGNLKDELFQHEMYNTNMAETLDFWRTMAEHFKGRAAVAMYELYNEPTITGDKFGDMTWDELKDLYHQMLAVIRPIDKKKICLVAGFNWAYNLDQVRESPLQAENIAYVSHPYPQKREKPWEEKWEKDWGFVADTYPVILTEVGFCLAGERGEHNPVVSTAEYGERLTAYCEKKGISWLAWVFDPNWAPMLFWDWSFEPTTQGKFWKNYLSSAK